MCALLVVKNEINCAYSEKVALSAATATAGDPFKSGFRANELLQRLLVPRDYKRLNSVNGTFLNAVWEIS